MATLPETTATTGALPADAHIAQGPGLYIDPPPAASEASAAFERVLTADEILGLQDADLPKEIGPAFFEAIRKRRALFPSRSEYNLMVCDEIMRAGEIPNVRSVLKVGGWGSAGDVSSDLDRWKTKMAARVDQETSPLPFAARRTADSLLMQLHHLASEVAAAPYEARIQAVMGELESSRSQLSEITNRHEALSRAFDAKVEELERVKAELNFTQEETKTIQQSLNASNAELSAAKATISEMTASHETLVVEIRRSNEAAANTLRTKHAEEIQALRSEHVVLHEKAAQAAQAAQRHAMAQISEARVEAQRWRDQAKQTSTALEQSRLLENKLREDLATRTIDEARAKASESAQIAIVGQLRSQVEALTAQLADMTALAAKRRTALSKAK